ncbi:hypothetical protein ACIQ8D_36540 [Streptomyces sp. NPDC096094]|uniref:hypothetical protein n=1 Tax=Streptomyces sp. NPDC096094 TaxID=3366073 RepID=UPI0037FE4420
MSRVVGARSLRERHSVRGGPGGGAYAGDASLDLGDLLADDADTGSRSGLGEAEPPMAVA